MTELQHLTFAEDGSLTLDSKPVLGITGGSKFTTATLVNVTSHTGDQAPWCRLHVKACCEAAGPWGMVGTIEGIMADQATAAIKKFMDFCAIQCAEAAPAAQLVRTTGAAVSPGWPFRPAAMSWCAPAMIW